MAQHCEPAEDTAYDVVICGAGVGGLTLAAVLGRQGRRVLLVEKQRRFRMMHKGELIQPGSLTVLDELGLLPHLYAAGALKVNALACRTADGADLVTLDYGLITGAYRHGLVQSYKDMLDTLADRLGPTVTFWRGTRVEDLIRDDTGRITGVSLNREGTPCRVAAALTVACDGQASRLRDAAGIQVAMHRYDHQLVGFEIEKAPPLGPDMNAHLTRHGLRALFELPGDRARLYVQIPVGSFREVGRAGVAGWTEGILRTMPAFDAIAEPLKDCLETVQVLSAWRFVAPRWSRPGFALLGDAAHCVHPMVGQGMNSAIGDAWSLGSELAEEPAGGRPLGPAEVDDALRRYEAVRRPRLEFVSRLSHNLATLLTTTSRTGRLLRPSLLRRNQSNVRLRRHITQNVAGLTAQPFRARDWISASGLLPRPSGRPLPARAEEIRP
ncbi:FAD-dependent oxidoreductase [Streptomyces sp. SLBN-8D4]|uniref:FAD-dependent oxidoreductase n=1 Tax=Streptomyces sp. SLBN-8D4 TaxID=3377728 RepID=UPI003C7C7770